MGKKRRQEPTTLLFLLQSLIQAEIIVELRNESQIVGTLDYVDDAMNLVLVDAEYMKGQVRSNNR
jgi:small nuclear ribonucleoprotein (snRNP)-like protein